MLALDKLTLDEVLKKAAVENGDKTFVSWVSGDAMTYAEFAEKVETVSNFLKDQGVTKGDNVAILSENQPNWAVAYFSITIIGAVAVPIMTEFQESEIQHILKHSASKAIFISGKLFDKIEGFQHEALECRVLIDDLSIIPPQTKKDLIKEIITGGKKELTKIKEAALKFVGWSSTDIKEDDIAAILYTSGTTGHSKGVMLSHKNIISDAIATLQIVEVGCEDRMLSILPLFHTMESTLGMVLPALQGTSVYYINKPPTAAVLIPAMQKVKPTAMVAVPLIIEKIFKQRIQPEINSKFLSRNLYKLPATRKTVHKIAVKKLMKIFGGELRMFCIGGAPLSQEVEKFMKEGGFPYAVGYGLTETSPLLTGTGPEKVRLGSAGMPIPGVEIEIREKNPNTGEGEIYARGPMVMQGYYKDPEKSGEVLEKDGWFRTGDLGMLDDRGYLYIKGRSKNVIIGSNGKNIYPEEIESLINESKYVLESLVGDRDGKLIARVYLNYDIIDEENQITKIKESKTRVIIDKILKDLLGEINGRVASFSKLSKIIEQPEPFKKTPTQKIKRYLYM